MVQPSPSLARGWRLTPSWAGGLPLPPWRWGGGRVATSEPPAGTRSWVPGAGSLGPAARRPLALSLLQLGADSGQLARTDPFPGSGARGQHSQGGEGTPRMWPKVWGRAKPTLGSLGLKTTCPLASGPQPLPHPVPYLALSSPGKHHPGPLKPCSGPWNLSSSGSCFLGGRAESSGAGPPDKPEECAGGGRCGSRCFILKLGSLGQSVRVGTGPQQATGSGWAKQHPHLLSMGRS